MNNENLREKLNDALITGVLEDILKAERAYLQARTIGENFEAINNSDHRIVLGMCQFAFSNEQSMAIGRMFDKVKGYPVRSIYRVLDILDEHIRNMKRDPGDNPLPILNLDALLNVLQDPQLADMSQQVITEKIVEHFRAGMPNDALLRLKEARDKTLAHNEAIDPVLRNYRRGVMRMKRWILQRVSLLQSERDT